MGYEAKVILDSVSPAGVRLTTIAATFPRFILAEMNTHRVFSRNTSSSRAIPIEKMIQAVHEKCFIPESWPINKPGMQATEMHTDRHTCREEWKEVMRSALKAAENFKTLGIHKQIANRLLEPFSWSTQLITATEWDNFFKLRCSPEAQPEMQKIATMIRDARDASTPKPIDYGAYHLPYITQSDSDYIWETSQYNDLMKISTARCARVSYLTHEGKLDIEKDLELFERLKASGHWSPFEHVATPIEINDPIGKLTELYQCSGNFHGWHQYRKEIESGTKWMKQ